MNRITAARTSAWILVLCMMLTFLPLFTVHISAAAQITETVNLSRPQKNMSGSGYYWDNRNKILTLDGLYISTSDDYGLRIPAGATVILKGKNYVTASVAALTVPGNVTFKGSGSLHLKSGDMGIYFYSTDDSTTARFLEGTYEVIAGGDGLHSEYTALSIVGGKMSINAPAADKYAILGREIKLYGGNLTMDNSVHASVSLEVQAVDLSVTSAKPALSSDKTLKVDKVSIKSGSAVGSLSSAEEYTGENCISLKSSASNLGSSILFGDSVPMFVDILIVLALLALIAAGIAFPFLRSYRNAKKAKEALAAALADEPTSRQK